MPRLAGLLFILASAVFSIAALSYAFVPDPGRLPEPQNASEQNLAIVVNVSNPISNLSMSELRKIFLGERSHWPNGRRITLVMMEAGQPERAVVLRDMEDFSYDEIARILEVPVGTVMSRIHRGRLALRALLANPLVQAVQQGTAAG